MEGNRKRKSDGYSPSKVKPERSTASGSPQWPRSPTITLSSRSPSPASVIGPPSPSASPPPPKRFDRSSSPPTFPKRFPPRKRFPRRPSLTDSAPYSDTAPDTVVSLFDVTFPISAHLNTLQRPPPLSSIVTVPFPVDSMVSYLQPPPPFVHIAVPENSISFPNDPYKWKAPPANTYQFPIPFPNEPSQYQFPLTSVPNQHQPPFPNISLRYQAPRHPNFNPVPSHDKFHFDEENEEIIISTPIEGLSLEEILRDDPEDEPRGRQRRDQMARPSDKKKTSKRAAEAPEGPSTTHSPIRAPRQLPLETEICRYYEQGYCARGDTCIFNHLPSHDQFHFDEEDEEIIISTPIEGLSLEEILRDDPEDAPRGRQRRDQKARHSDKKKTSKRVDSARDAKHSPIRAPRQLPLETEICRYYEQGYCARGDTCWYAHVDEYEVYYE